jgi:hypothetical protein
MNEKSPPTPDELALARMIAEAGSPEAAAQHLIARLQELEAVCAQLEAAAAVPGAQVPECPAAPVEETEERD